MKHYEGIDMTFGEVDKALASLHPARHPRRLAQVVVKGSMVRFVWEVDVPSDPGSGDQETATVRDGEADPASKSPDPRARVRRVYRGDDDVLLWQRIYSPLEGPPRIPAEVNEMLGMADMRITDEPA